MTLMDLMDDFIFLSSLCPLGLPNADLSPAIEPQVQGVKRPHIVFSAISRFITRGTKKIIMVPGRGNGRISNLPPEKSILPPREIFPVSPVATFSRILQIYSNGTRWYFIFQSPVQANLYWQAILRYLEK